MQYIGTQRSIAEIEKPYVYINTKRTNKQSVCPTRQSLVYCNILCPEVYSICLLYEASTWTEKVHPKSGNKRQGKSQANHCECIEDTGL